MFMTEIDWSRWLTDEDEDDWLMKISFFPCDYEYYPSAIETRHSLVAYVQLTTDRKQLGMSDITF